MTEILLTRGKIALVDARDSDMTKARRNRLDVLRV